MYSVLLKSINFYCLFFRSSLEFLSVSMQFYPLPENYHPIQPLILASSSERGSYPFRRHLLDWMLPIPDVGEPNKGLLTVLTCQSTTRTISTRLIGEVLSSLCLRTVSSASFTEKPLLK